jgi:hypothetical protein
MTPVLCSWREVFPAVGRAWNRFFHQPADGRLVVLLRVFYAAVLLVNVLLWWPNLERWFGGDGVLPKDIAKVVFDSSAASLLPESRTALWTCYFIFLAQIVLLLVGVFPRVQAWCVFAWLVSFQHRQPMIWDSEDAVMRLLGFYLLFAPLQVGALIAWRRPVFDCPANAAAPSGWAIRLIQIQMCLIFLLAAFAKLHGDSWLDGTAVYYAARLNEFAVIGAPTDFLFESPWIVALLTWGTIAIEAVTPMLLWFRETRRTALVVLLLFHIGCMLTMHLFLFHWIMLCGWCAFLSSDDLDWVWRRTIPSASHLRP